MYDIADKLEAALFDAYHAQAEFYHCCSLKPLLLFSAMHISFVSTFLHFMPYQGSVSFADASR